MKKNIIYTAFFVLMFLVNSCTKDKGELIKLAIGCDSTTIPSKRFISVAEFQFTPSTLNCVVGDTIVWQWVSGFHPVVSTSVPSGAAAVNSGEMNSGNTSYQYIIQIPGTYNISCTYHESSDGMVGTLFALSKCN